jgi:hypothetical protein
MLRMSLFLGLQILTDLPVGLMSGERLAHPHASLSVSKVKLYLFVVKLVHNYHAQL